MNSIRIILLVLLFSLSSATAKDKGPWKEQFIEVGDIKIRYLDAGSGDRTLVFIPGWTMPAEVWRDQIGYFSSRGFRVIAFDPRSQGMTTKTEIGNSYYQHAADLHQFLKNLKIEHSYLIGWDAGVLTLLEYISSPETTKPEKMVFVGGSPAALKSEDYPGATTVKQIRSLFLDLQDNRSKATEKYVHSLFTQGHPQFLYTELMDACSKTPMSAAISLLFDQFTGDRRAALLRVPVPTLIMTTPENRQLGEYMNAKTPRSNLLVIEEAGNAMFLDKPQAFNQAIESFLGDK
jgi:non-heme chloroperoxidase